MIRQRYFARCAALMTIAIPVVLSSPVISVQPGPLGVNQTFTVSIAASGINDLYAFQFDISFSPQVIAATAITEGAFLPTGGPTVFVPGAIDNAAGTISFIADSLLGSVPGVSGTGILANVIFHGVDQGISPIDLANVQFLDSTLSPIVVATVPGNSPLITPEPSSALLVLCALIMVAAPWRWSSRTVECDSPLSH